MKLNVEGVSDLYSILKNKYVGESVRLTELLAEDSQESVYNLTQNDNYEETVKDFKNIDVKDYINCEFSISLSPNMKLLKSDVKSVLSDFIPKEWLKS